jgi:hypothetical protein
MKLQYRAIEGTNTKTRRLAYFSVIILTLQREGLSEHILLDKLIVWSQRHKADLNNYHVQTGEITSTRKNSAGAHYLELAMKAGLIVPIAGMYRTSRIGLMVMALLKKYHPKANPFFLNRAEQIFYLYHLLKIDADMLLTVVDCILRNEGSSLNQLQQLFRESFLTRLNDKGLYSQDELLAHQLRDRQHEVANEWKRPERYTEHIVPPRLNWLLDLHLLNKDMFRLHRFVPTEEGRQFFYYLPCLGKSNFRDVTEQWLDLEFWDSISRTLLKDMLPTSWSRVNEETKYNTAKLLLAEAFAVFRSSFAPTISLTQAVLYLCVRFLLEYGITVSPSELRAWFSTSPVLDHHRYEVRLSPRENESYLLMKDEEK